MNSSNSFLSFIHSLLCFVSFPFDSFIHSVIHSFIHLRFRFHFHSVIHSIMCLFVREFTHFFHAFNQSLHLSIPNETSKTKKNDAETDTDSNSGKELSSSRRTRGAGHPRLLQEPRGPQTLTPNTPWPFPQNAVQMQIALLERPTKM